MLLSRLVYEAVKNVKYLDDTEFTLEAFRKGDFVDDLDYANSINNAFTPINEAIHRLSDLGKIRHRIATVEISTTTGTIDFSSVEEVVNHPIKEILSVFVYSNAGDDYITFPFREVGVNKIQLVGARLYAGISVNIEYIEDIPMFSLNDYNYPSTVYDETEDEESYRDVELRDYGINDTMASYIIEYTKGALFEPIAPEIANMHTTRAEQYFADLPIQQTSFYQKEIRKTHSIL